MRWWKSGDLKKTEFVSRLSEMNPAKWGILLLFGVLLAVAAMPVSSKQQKKNTAGEQSEDMQKSVLEEKLEAFLENTEGVGKVQVILMTDEKKDRQSFSDFCGRWRKSCSGPKYSGGGHGIISGGCS